MSDENENKKTASELVLDLTFVPSWAKKPPGANPFEGMPEPREKRGGRRGEGRAGNQGRNQGGNRGRGQAGSHAGGRGGDRAGDRRSSSNSSRNSSGAALSRDRKPGQERGPSGGPSQNNRQGGSRAGRGPDRGRGGQGRRDEHRSGDRRPFKPLPLRVSILPARETLSNLAHELKKSNRAYSLSEIGSRFFDNADFCSIKLEVLNNPKDPKDKGFMFYQSVPDGQIFRDRTQAEQHVLATCAEAYYTVEERQVDPPSGNFVIIARCKLSGTLLGPPNHHSYKQRLTEIWKTKYGKMSFDKYQANVETVRDPELIEKWKQEATTQKFYKLKQDESKELQPREIEAHFREHYAADSVRELTRAVIPGSVARKLNDRAILDTIHRAWNRESRSPRTILYALKPALRHNHFQFFKAGKNETFLTAITPRPLLPEQAEPGIAEIIQFLHDHPGCSRQELVEGLRPGVAVESDEVNQVIHHISWLIERGHVIEFYNGTLSVPRLS